MLERGTVREARRGVLSVSMESSADCEKCGACAAGAGGERLLEGVIDEHGAQPGDLVEIETPIGARRRAQGLVYVVPVVALLIGYMAGFLLSSLTGFWSPDTVGAFLALAAGIGALLLLRLRNQAFDTPSARPRVRAIIARGHESRGGCAPIE